MKNLISRTLSLILLGFLLAAGKADAQDITVSYQSFYDNLAPYGQWINDPEYGDVWVPNEDGDFRPYGSRGHWVMTEYGNTWVSEDPWGWAVYHYGRWTYNPYYGWVWVPGYEWAPAWVSWRYGGGYSGWAPLGPGMNIGVSYNYPESWWIFVSPQYMYQPNCIHYWRGPSYNPTYIRQTTIINNYYVDNSTHVRYNYGPRADVIQQVTHRPVPVYRVAQLNRPGAPSVGRNTVSLYRPSVNRSTINTARPQGVIQAPRPIGRAPQAANAPTGNRQPAFRQEVQRLQNNPGQRGNEPRRQEPQGRDNRQQLAPQRQQEQQRQPELQRNQQPQRQQMPQRQPEEQQRMREQERQPEMQRNQQSQRQQEPQRQQMPQRQPEPQRQQMMPQRQPEPLRQQMMPQRQPEPQRQQMMPQRQPEPQRQQMMPQRQMEPPRQQMPQQQPPMRQPQQGPPHEGGRR